MGRCLLYISKMNLARFFLIDDDVNGQKIISFVGQKLKVRGDARSEDDLKILKVVEFSTSF